MVDSKQTLHPKFGRGMALATWLSVMVLLYLLFENWLDESYNPNTEPESHLTEDGSATVLLKSNRQGHYVASGTLNGKPTVFLLDTGATSVAVPAHMADFFNLKPGAARRVYTANGVVMARNALIQRMRIGDIELKQVRANLVPNMPDDTILLGMSALGRVSFSQEDGHLLLKKR